jgi:hypothetical protein
VNDVVQAWHLAWSGVPLHYRSATVASQRRLLPKKLIVAQITNKLLSAHPNQRTVCVHILSWPSVRTSLKIRFNIIWCISGCFFCSGFPTKILYTFLTFAPLLLTACSPNGWTARCAVLQALLPLHSNSQRPLLKDRPSVQDRVAINGTVFWGVAPYSAAYRTNIFSLAKESATTSETSVLTYETIQCHISEDGQFQVIYIRISDESTTENTFGLKAIFNSSKDLWPFRIRFYAAKYTD